MEPETPEKKTMAIPKIVPNHSGNKFQTEDGAYYVQFEVDQSLAKMRIIDTVSPKKLRDSLLGAAFDHARENGWQIETPCPQASAYAREYPSRGVAYCGWAGPDKILYNNPSFSGNAIHPPLQARQQFSGENHLLCLLVLLFIGWLDSRLLFVLLVVFVLYGFLFHLR